MHLILAQSPLQGPDHFILVGYFVLMLGIGAYFYRYNRQMKDYFSGGNRIPWWLSGVSYYMSCFSVFAFIAYAALCWRYGWLGVTVFWFMAPATLVSAMLFARRWRRARIDSPVEYLEVRYSPAVRQVFAWQNIPVRIIDDALKLVSIGFFIEIGLGLNMMEAMFWSGLIMLVYTLMGGLWAVAVTDFVQFIVLLAAVLIVLPLSISRAGGLERVFTQVPEGFFALTQPEYSWAYIGSNVLLFCLSFSSINWALIQRYYCVPRERDALKVGWLVFALNVIGPPVILLPVMAARQFLTGVDDPKYVYPMLCIELLPPGMLGLVIAAMFSATMSMLSSDYNVCAGVLTNDVYRRYIRPAATQGHLVLVGRLMTLLIGLISLGVALLMAAQSGEDLFRNMITLFSVATAPVALPMIAGLLTHRVNNKAALSAFVAGASVGLITLWTCPDSFERFGATWRRENAILWMSTFATLVVMTGVSLAFRPGERERGRVEAFLRRLRVPIGEAAEEQEAQAAGGSQAVSPMPVVGLSTLLIGLMMLAVLPWGIDGLEKRLNLGVGAALAVVGGLMIYGGRTGLRRQVTSGEVGG